MAANYRLNEVSQIRDRNVFIDANVLIYLFWPTGQHRYEESYAKVFRLLLKQGNRLFVDFLVVSEVVNRIIRIENVKVASTLKFKDFRESEVGQSALKDIYTILKENVLNRFEVTGKAFNKMEIEGLLIPDTLDIVDKAIAIFCKESNFVLLTNDKDFRNTGLDILTGNSHILNS
ncbi:type II toxin-antitoxin system VapC family toxin [Fluviicola sp.]|jgi:predicted nucleic acid-binding protein|uniref:type II toxin-antitoxin system VapC family toxin n=1 Tax=Fluviicola sp. TaxID=1917219 RepID=UPI0028225760|nr:type II toxin-antitoxin system VapC family toxin [Fluviicola sp.]MDR0802319.1 type II toxin-antitoxin system VapC family toxin [Fluviicola sp.]